MACKLPCTSLSASTTCGYPLLIAGLEGTVEYCAPEVLRGEPFAESCDVYSFGEVYTNHPESITFSWQLLALLHQHCCLCS